jgi:hypothetical protein
MQVYVALSVLPFELAQASGGLKNSRERIAELFSIGRVAWQLGAVRLRSATGESTVRSSKAHRQSNVEMLPI